MGGAEHVQAKVTGGHLKQKRNLFFSKMLDDVAVTIAVVIREKEKGTKFPKISKILCVL